MEKSKLDALQLNMHDLEKKVNGKLNSKPTQDLRICNMTDMFNIRKNSNHSSSHPTQRTLWTISSHPIPAHTFSQQIYPTPINFDALQSEGIHEKMEKSKLDALQLKMHDLEKKVNGKLNSKPTHDLRYKKFFLHPRVELPSRYKIPKFNMFDGNGHPITYLKDFCSRLVVL
ncbi:hypothetical protein H5410_046736 [Solanum commersonii]|uniref:Uncharacterized protein n=1 Tax=Solanum commersonii TaxID=4109 RepID=A0A9J5XGK3_SOLCO|nr:hypothetical protein H5410_046736 [Solanum commersonii]